MGDYKDSNHAANEDPPVIAMTREGWHKLHCGRRLPLIGFLDFSWVPNSIRINVFKEDSKTGNCIAVHSELPGFLLLSPPRNEISETQKLPNLPTILKKFWSTCDDIRANPGTFRLDMNFGWVIKNGIVPFLCLGFFPQKVFVWFINCVWLLPEAGKRIFWYGGKFLWSLCFLLCQWEVAQCRMNWSKF